MPAALSRVAALVVAPKVTPVTFASAASKTLTWSPPELSPRPPRAADQEPARQAAGVPGGLEGGDLRRLFEEHGGGARGQNFDAGQGAATRVGVRRIGGVPVGQVDRFGAHVGELEPVAAVGGAGAGRVDLGDLHVGQRRRGGRFRRARRADLVVGDEGAEFTVDAQRGDRRRGAEATQPEVVVEGRRRGQDAARFGAFVGAERDAGDVCFFGVGDVHLVASGAEARALVAADLDAGGDAAAEPGLDEVVEFGHRCGFGDRGASSFRRRPPIPPGPGCSRLPARRLRRSCGTSRSSASR